MRGGNAPPQHLTFVGDKVYVTLGGEHQVAVLDAASREVVARVPVGKQPHGIWPSADGKRLFVANEEGHDLTVIDVASGKAVGAVAVGRKVPITVPGESWERGSASTIARSVPPNWKP